MNFRQLRAAGALAVARRAAPAPRGTPPRWRPRSAGVLLARDAGDHRQAVGFLEGGALERAAVLVEQVERAHQRARRRPAARSPRWPARTAARAGRAPPRSRGAVASCAATRSGSTVSRRSPIATPASSCDLVGGDVGRSRRRGSPAPRTGARRSRGGPAAGPPSTDSATTPSTTSDLADDQQLAPDQRAPPASSTATDGRANGTRRLRRRRNQPRCGGVRSTTTAPAASSSIGAAARSRQRFRSPSSVISSVGTPVMSPAPRHSTRSPGRPASASAAGSRSRDTWRARAGREGRQQRRRVDAGDRRLARRRRCRSARARRRRPARARTRAADRACACSGAAGTPPPAAGRRAAPPRSSPPARSGGGRSRRRPARRPTSPRTVKRRSTPSKLASASPAVRERDAQEVGHAQRRQRVDRVVDARHADAAPRRAAVPRTRTRKRVPLGPGLEDLAAPVAGRQPVGDVALGDRAAPGAPPRGCRRRSRPIRRTAPSRQSLKTRRTAPARSRSGRGARGRCW